MSANNLGKTDSNILNLNEDFSIKIESSGNSNLIGENINMDSNIGNNTNKSSWKNTKDLV
jgi:hypothetical protein